MSLIESATRFILEARLGLVKQIILPIIAHNGKELEASLDAKSKEDFWALWLAIGRRVQQSMVYKAPTTGPGLRPISKNK